MAKPKRLDTRSWTPSQVVAHNLTRARQLRGLTQSEIAERLSNFTGSPWSAVTVAQAEGSVTGQRVRQFTANELVALAQTFDLPVLYFFLPPEDGSGELRTPNGELPWEYLLMLVWGHRRNFAHVAARAAPWAHASTVLVPYDDDVNPAEDLLDTMAGMSDRHRLTPEDMLAVAFNGMARAHIRDSFAGEDLRQLAVSLRRLAHAFETFENYAPGTFFDTETLRRMAGSDPDDDDGGDGDSTDAPKNRRKP